MQNFVRAIVGVALLLGAAGPALAADSPDPSASAKAHFEEGTKAFNLGEFKRAVDEYRAAYNAKPDPVFLYNIAQAYRLAGDLGQALFFYKSFVRNEPNAPNRREVERRVHDLEIQIERQKSLSTAPPNGPVAPGTTASSESRAPAPREPLPPEPAQTTPKAPPPSTSPAAPEPATTPTPSVPPPEAVAAAQPSTAPSAALTTTTTDKHTPVYKKWWLWTIVGGVVVAGVVVGVVVAETSGPAAAPTSHFGTMMAF